MTEKTTLRLLLAEESANDELLLLYELIEAGNEVEHRRVDTPQDLAAALSNGGWQAVICAHPLSRFSGFEALRIVREIDAQIPIILISGSLTEADCALAMELGANDYLLKSNLTRLAPALKRELEEARLRRAGRITTAQYENILNHASDAIITVDEIQRIVLFNRAAEETFGYRPEEVLGQSLSLLIPERLRERHGRLFASMRDSATAARLLKHGPRELLGRHRDGRAFPIEIHISSTEVERRTTYTAIVRDITERKSLEEALKRQNEELEERVASRTAELEAARQEAERLAAAKSEFLANMSHEIRTPMNAVLGLAYMLRQMDLPEDAADLAKKIHRSGESLLGIINDILDFSKIEAGRLTVEKVPFNLADVLDNLATIMATSAAGKGLELIIAPPPLPHCRLAGDALRIGQVLINLTGNAIKFTDKGLVEVKIEPQQVSNDQVTLRFCVRDTGIGMDAADQARLFAAFEQADASTTRRFGGTGLGLAISRRLVELMGGRMDLVSEPGVGSTFSFVLTLQRLDAQARRGELSRLKVLIADDNPVSLEGFGATVQSMGWTPELFESGRALVDRVLEDPHLQTPKTVLLLDWQMPDLGGLEVARALKSALGTEARPVELVITAHGPEQVADKLDPDLIDGVLSKPLGQSMLYNAILRARQKRIDGDEPSVEKTAPGERLRGVRLLIVDDSEINREVAERIFRHEGAEVSAVTDGQQALKWLALYGDLVDVVLMDVHMPVMDGLEATRKIREHDEFKELPVVALTAGAMQEQRERALAAGMSGFIPKPFDAPSAVKLILRLLQAPAGSQFNDSPAAADAKPTAAPALLNTDQGLRLFDDAAAYHRYLRLFAKDYQAALSLLRLPNTAPGTIAELAHKLRGAAANLGLERLANAGEEVENRIRRNQPVADAIAKLADVLAQSLQQIDAYLPDSASPNAQPAPDPSAENAELEPLIRQALAGLEAFDPAAVEPPLAELRRFLSATQLEPAASALDRFSFDEAETALRHLAATLAIPLEP